MEISLNHDELREVLELVHIGTCVRNSVFEDMGELDEKDGELENKLLEFAIEHHLSDVEECEHGLVHLSTDLEEGCHYIIEAFGENYFWSEFIARLEVSGERKDDQKNRCSCG